VVRRLGSPPRAWGQSLRRIAQERQARFTPTGVGTICQSPSWSLVLSVHPHGRGDNGAVNGVPDGASGSPPRAWGQCHRHHSMRRARRFTPTGVGTIREWASDDARRLGSPPRAWGQFDDSLAAHALLLVHPHGRGDNVYGDLVAGDTVGSPPRAWGQCAGCRRRG